MYGKAASKTGMTEFDFNCNQGGGCDDKPNPCGCSKSPCSKKSYDGACGSLYDSGSTGCDGKPKDKESECYAEGANAFSEALKVPRCGCDCQPYEEGAFPFKNEYHPPKVNTQKPAPCKNVGNDCSLDLSQRYPVECNNDETYADGENCALCIKEH